MNNEPNGIFLELERWFGNTEKKGILQIGNFTGGFFKRFVEFGFKNVNYIENEELNKMTDKTKVFYFIRNEFQNFNTIFINANEYEYDIVSEGIPANIDVIIIRFNKNQKRVKMDTLIKFIEFCGLDQKYLAEHKKGDIVDLFFIRRK